MLCPQNGYGLFCDENTDKQLDVSDSKNLETISTISSKGDTP